MARLTVPKKEDDLLAMSRPYPAFSIKSFSGYFGSRLDLLRERNRFLCNSFEQGGQHCRQ
jgi:hypothetical protein